MKNKKAFTLVELIVGITISMLLMISVGVFVTGGMRNITLQKKVLNNNKKTSSDILYLQKNILNSKQYISDISDTGILLRQNKYFDKGGFSYIGVKKFDGIYCGIGEITKTDHLYVSNFIPLTGVTTGTTNYKSDIKKHQILKKSDGSVVVGRDIFGDKFVEGSKGTDVFLNSPTGIVEIDNKVVFSDTLNDRILYLSGSRVYTLLDENDGLNEPIGLAYNNSEKALYIANAGKGKILKFYSKKYSNNPDLEIKNVSQNHINKLELEIINTSKTLEKPNFDNISNSNNNIVELKDNKINYYFVNNYNNNKTRAECSGKSSGDIIFDYPHKVIKCTNNTGSGALAHFKDVEINNFTVKNIKPLLLENKSYYVKLNLYKNNTLKYSKYFPYFTQGDDNIFTKNNNTLEIIKEDGLKYSYNVNHNGDATNFDSRNFDYSTLKEDFIFSNPVKNLDIRYYSDLLNIKLNYYKYLNCFNPDEKIERTFLIKKNYK